MYIYIYIYASKHYISVTGTDLPKTVPLFRGSNCSLLLVRTLLSKKLTYVDVA